MSETGISFFSGGKSLKFEHSRRANKLRSAQGSRVNKIEFKILQMSFGGGQNNMVTCELDLSQHAPSRFRISKDAAG
jgi:hypothetical protein